MKKVIFTLIVLFTLKQGIAQQGISAFNTPYIQNFDSLKTSDFSLTDNVTLNFTGWYSFRTTGNATPNTLFAGAGTAATGRLYNFGGGSTPPTSDRAMGALTSSGTGTTYYGIRFKNNTGSAINYLSIAYVGEQWRAQNASAQSLTVDYQIGTTVTSLTTGTWTNVPALTFTSPRNIAGPTNTDGNNNFVGNRVPNINTTLATTINAGDEIFIRWVDIDHAGTDHALAIDSLVVTAVTPTNWYYSGTGNLNNVANWSSNTNGVGGTNPADFSSGVQIFNILDNNATTTISTSGMGNWSVTGNCRVKIGSSSSNPITLTFATSNDITGFVDIDQSNSSTGNKIILESTVPSLSSLHNTSIVEFASSSSQTFPTTNYGSIISSSTGERIINSSIGIAGAYTPGSNTYTVTGSTINFNGSSTQTIPSCSVQNVRLSNNCTLPFGNTLNIISGSTSFIVGSGFTFNVSGKIKSNHTTVSGSYFTLSGATLNMLTGSEFEIASNGGTIPQTNTVWDANSTLNITGFVKQLPTGRNQVFGNVVWNAPLQDTTISLTGSAASFNVTGTFTIENTGLGQLTLPGGTLPNVPVNNYVQNGGYVNILGPGAPADRALTVSGNFTLNGGTFMLANQSGFNGVLNIAGSFTRTGGSFTRQAGNGNVVLNGAAPQTITGTVTFHNLNLNNATGATITAGVGNSVTISGSVVATSGNLATNGNLIIASTETSTARVGNSGGTITGNVTVNRFLPARRAWRFLTAPVTQSTPSSLNTTWQDSVDIVGPTGTNLSAIKAGYNFLTYNAATNAWENVSNPASVNLTGSSLNNAFAAFIPGRKTTVLGDSTNVTLVSTGELLTGTKTFNITAASGNYALIPNPYASPVDLDAVYAASTNINRNFYTWDPRQGGSIGTGGYITISWNGASYDILGNGNATTQDLNLQSGQAYFVHASSANPSVVFNETAKTTTNNNTVFGAGTGNVDNLKIGMQRIESGSPVLVGEVLASYHNNYSKSVNFNDDAEKMWNNEENIALNRDGYKLSIERRPFIGASSDSIFLGLSSLKANTNYSLEFKPSNWDAGSKAYLIDKLLSTETLIDLNSTSFVHQFTSTVATANDRFVVVFRGATLPNRGFTLGAEKLGTNKVKVNWEAQGETGVRAYTLEKSVDGVNYQAINTQVAKNNNSLSNYTFTDNNPVNGVNYYRVKTTQQNDVERYSSIVTINFKQQSSNPVTVYPNPVRGNQIGLQLQDIQQGMYSIRIVSIEGKEVYKQQLQVNSGSLNTTISPSSKLASGTYTLQVVGKNNSYTQKLVIE